MLRTLFSRKEGSLKDVLLQNNVRHMTVKFNKDRIILASNELESLPVSISLWTAKGISDRSVVSGHSNR